MFLFLQEYCKFKNMEDGAFPSVYIGLKDKLSGIHKVITDSTAHLIQLLQSYKVPGCFCPSTWYPAIDGCVTREYEPILILA